MTNRTPAGDEIASLEEELAEARAELRRIVNRARTRDVLVTTTEHRLARLEAKEAVKH